MPFGSPWATRSIDRCANGPCSSGPTSLPPVSERMLERFVRLCEIASPTGSERAVADAVLAELRELGVEVGRGRRRRAGAGRRGQRRSRGSPGEQEGWVMFAAHLDTVPHDGPIEVRVRRRRLPQRAARRSSAPTTRPRSRCSSSSRRARRRSAAAARPRARLHGRRGGRAARGEGARPRRDALAASATSSTTRARSAR